MSEESAESTLERIMNERRDKAAQLRAAGSDPYRNDIKPTIRLGAIRTKYGATAPAPAAASAPVEPGAKRPGIQPVDDVVHRVAGRAMARRGMGKTVFVPIQDDTGTLQLFINVDHLDAGDFAGILPLLDTGDVVAAEGRVFWTKTGELSLLASRLHIVTKSVRPLPDKWHGLTDVEIRYRQRYVDLAINPDVRAVFRKRAEIVSGIRRYLDSRGFLEVETPMMHPIIGGAAARPFITHHNALDMKLYMRIAPELYLKRLLVGGFDRVYEINRNFRNEGLSRRHNPEFTMLEFYWAYADYRDLMNLTEEMVVGLAQEINGSTQVSWDGADLELARPWRRLTVRDAVAELGGVGAARTAALFEDPALAAEVAIEVGVSAGDVLRVLREGGGAAIDTGAAADAADPAGADEAAAFRDPARRPAVARALLERYASAHDRRVCAGHLGYLIFEHTAEAQLVQPTFLTEFPLAVSPLARKTDADPAFCDRFEMFAAGKEIANAFSELNDPADQRARFVGQLAARAAGAAETMDYDEDYCRALEVGMPPAAGEGIGIDRLTMMLTGQASIRDVILFPLMRPT